MPEAGDISISEVKSVRGALGAKIERDLYFKATYPTSGYAEAAWEMSQIVISETTAPCL